MSAHELLNLFDKLSRGCAQVFYHFFLHEFDKFNKTRVQILDSVYHMYRL